MRLGDGDIFAETDPKGVLDVTGVLFKDFQVDAHAQLRGDGVLTEARVGFQNLILDNLVPPDRLPEGGRGRATGYVSFRSSPSSTPTGTLVLSDLKLEAQGDAGTPTSDSVSLRVLRGLRARLELSPLKLELDNTVFVTEAGRLELGGQIEQKNSGVWLDGKAQGNANLALLKPLLRNRFENLREI